MKNRLAILLKPFNLFSVAFKMTVARKPHHCGKFASSGESLILVYFKTVARSNQ